MLFISTTPCYCTGCSKHFDVWCSKTACNITNIWLSYLFMVWFSSLLSDVEVYRYEWSWMLLQIKAYIYFPCYLHWCIWLVSLSWFQVIDACAKGNLGRFINHSCEPNCRTEKVNYFYMATFCLVRNEDLCIFINFVLIHAWCECMVSFKYGMLCIVKLFASISLKNCINLVVHLSRIFVPALFLLGV